MQRRVKVYVLCHFVVWGHWIAVWGAKTPKQAVRESEHVDNVNDYSVLDQGRNGMGPAYIDGKREDHNVRKQTRCSKST